MWTLLYLFTVYIIISVNSQNSFGFFGNHQQQPSIFPINFNLNPFLPQQQSNPNNFGGFFFPGQYNPNTGQPIGNNQNVPVNRPNRPTNRPTINNNFRPTPNNQPVFQNTASLNPTGNRISDRKCTEYRDASKNTVYVGSLTPQSHLQGISTEQCDVSQGLIVGGENARIGEFPHMAAIGYADINNEVHFSCGGSLISERYVLTAAHCKKASGLRPSVVRLGDLNLKVKNFTEVDVEVDKFIGHELYDSSNSKHDIALIRLKTTVAFTKYIKPACLMTSDFIGKKKVIATGWGLTEALSYKTSDIMQKVELNLIDNTQCNQIFDDPTQYNLDNTQLCAGELSGGKDTCQGDSGGPLQIVNDKSKCSYTIIGITSYGSIYCGSANSPGVYTKVFAYLDWIERNVWGSKK